MQARFTLGEVEPMLRVDGYDTGRTWNGFCCPLVNAEGVQRFCAWWDPKDNDGLTYRWDAERRVLVMSSLDDCREHIIGPDAKIDDEDFYDLSLGLCWRLDNTDDDNEEGI